MPKKSNKFQPIFNTNLVPERNLTLASHQAYISDSEKIERRNIRVSDVIQFMYDGEERTVFVLNPEHDMKLHGLSLKSIDRRMMMVEVFAKMNLYNTPEDFYKRVISQDPVQKADAYRTYDVRRMGNIRRVEYQINEREEL